MQFMLKGVGLWRIVSGDELAPSRPDPNPSPDPIPVATSSRASRSFVAEQQKPPQQPPQQPPETQAYEVYKAAYLQYQTRCDLAASYIYSSLGIKAIEHLGNFTEPREMWDILKTRLNSLPRQVGITRTHTSFLDDEMKDHETVSSYIARLSNSNRVIHLCCLMHLISWPFSAPRSLTLLPLFFFFF